MITILDLGISNLNSVLNALQYLGVEYSVTNDNAGIYKASHLLLPGVGTFSEGMRMLNKYDLVDPLRDAALHDGKFIFGICLGMQLMFERSEESAGVEGLGIVEGSVTSLPKSDKYQIPRIGWADSIIRRNFLSLQENDVKDFYYIHSYFCEPKHSDIITVCDKDEPRLVCAIKKDNIYGCQFHPEKSHNAGLGLLKKFAEEE